jgi:D-3-phosphoglycerate dehydrogenase
MNIVATSPSFSKSVLLQHEIYRFFPDAKLNIEGKRFNKKELISYIKNADGIIVGLESIDDEVLEACPNLKIISKYGVGLNNIDLDACKKRDISIGWTGGVNRLSVAEMVLGYMLMLSRNLFVTSNQLKKGCWNKNGGGQLSNKTVGVIGVGYIGKEIIRLLRPFNCKIMVNDIILQNDYYYKNNLIESSKDEIYKHADIITIHTPLDSTTQNLINKESFAMMKKTAFVLNSSRGGIINEYDLKMALQNKVIAGAAVDVYVEEPPTDSELLSCENLICTPHIGGNANEAIEAMGLNAIKHIQEFFL